MPTNGVVGETHPVRDAALKVTGRLQYVDDMYPMNMLYGKILFSPVAHANIKSIDTSKAEALKGVRAVVCYKNSPQTEYNCNGEDRNDLPNEKLFDSRVRYVGDRVAAVAADTKEIAEAAIKLIEVEYEELPFYLEPEDAMEDGAYPIHENGNILQVVELSAGDVENAWKDCYKAYERTYCLPQIYHSTMEPHGCIADYDYTGKLTVITPTQDAFGQRFNLQRIFGIPMNKIRVVNPAMGGGFGSKIDLITEHVAALLAMKTMRPVKLILNRREDIAGGRTRHSMHVKDKIGVDREGNIIALDIEAIVNAGAQTSCTMSVVWAMGGKVFKNLKTKNIHFKGIPVYTNTTPAAAMRGFGSPQAFFGEQCLINTIAKDLKIPVAEMQMKNIVEPRDCDPGSGEPYGNARVRDALKKAMELMEYEDAVKEQEKTAKENSRYRIGVGIGIGSHGSSLYGIMPDTTGCMIKMNEDGTATLYTGVSDMGNGSVTTSVLIASEILGMKPDDFAVIQTDSEAVMWDVGSYASRGTFVGGGAALKAAKKVRSLLAEQAGKLLEADPSKMEFKDRRVFIKDDPDKSASLAEIMDFAKEKSNTDIVAAETFSTYAGPMCYGVHICKVEVDMETGKVKPLRYVSVHDVGKAINPGNLQGQQQGGIHMGLGYALTEAVTRDEKGKITCLDLNKYHILRASEMPEIRTGVIEEIESSGPFGAKSIGECAVVPSAPAVVNAVSNAVDREFFETPLTPERVLAAIRRL